MFVHGWLGKNKFYYARIRVGRMEEEIHSSDDRMLQSSRENKPHGSGDSSKTIERVV